MHCLLSLMNRVRTPFAVQIVRALIRHEHCLRPCSVHSVPCGSRRNYLKNNALRLVSCRLSISMLALICSYGICCTQVIDAASGVRSGFIYSFLKEPSYPLGWCTSILCGPLLKLKLVLSKQVASYLASCGHPAGDNRSVGCTRLR